MQGQNISKGAQWKEQQMAPEAKPILSAFSVQLPACEDDDGWGKDEVPRECVEKAITNVVAGVRNFSRKKTTTPTTKFKHDVMMNSIAEALRAVADEKIFIELPRRSQEFKDAVEGTQDLLYRRGTILVLDRVWNINSYPLRSKYYETPPEKRGNEVIGFHSSKVSNLIGIAKEGFQVNSSAVSISTGKKEMLGRLVYTADLCRNAIKYSDEFTFCLVATIFEGNVYETEDAMEDMTVAKLKASVYDTIHAKNVSKRGYIRGSPPERVLPRQLLMFRKVRRDDLWIYIHYGLAPKAPMPLGLVPQAHQRMLNPFLRKFVAKLKNDTRAFWNKRAKNSSKSDPMQPVLALQSKKYACFSSRMPVSVLHFIAVPKARMKWSDLTPESAYAIAELYAFASYVKTELQCVQECPQLSILFPVCPSQDQVYCHIIAKSEMNMGYNPLKYENLIGVETFICNLVAGNYSNEWYLSKDIDPSDGYWS